VSTGVSKLTDRAILANLLSVFLCFLSCSRHSTLPYGRRGTKWFYRSRVIEKENATRDYPDAL